MQENEDDGDVAMNGATADGEEEDSDPEMEAFANELMEKEMKKMSGGVDDLEEEDEDYLDELDGEGDDDEEDDGEEDGEEGFDEDDG